MRTLSILLLALGLAGCGFQLRGAASLPFERLYIEGAQDITVNLARSIRPSATQVVSKVEDAQAILQILNESRERRILSLDRAGRVSEFQLLYRVSFRVRDTGGRDLLAPQLIELRREMTYSDSDRLAKEAEEAVLYRDMQNDAAQQIVRRLGAVRIPS